MPKNSASTMSRGKSTRPPTSCQSSCIKKWLNPESNASRSEDSNAVMATSKQKQRKKTTVQENSPSNDSESSTDCPSRKQSKQVEFVDLPDASSTSEVEVIDNGKGGKKNQQGKKHITKARSTSLDSNDNGSDECEPGSEWVSIFINI